MPQSQSINRRIVLASRPQGAPSSENFRMEECPVPEPNEGQILIRTIYLSLDPYMRGRMSDRKSYAEPVALDDVMVGGTVGRVATSRHPDFQEGDWVLSYSGWQDYALSDGTGITPLGKAPATPSYALGIMGMPGFTAYMGLLDIGKPQAGETLVVAAATGPVGATVGQIGKLKGCRVVGIAGDAEKCRHAREILGFDDCLDRKDPNFSDKLKKACPYGIDVYFENVGGAVFDAVLPLLNTGARIPVCGLISQYNATQLPDGPDRLSLLVGQILTKRLTVKGFIIFDDYAAHYPVFAKEMGQWLANKKIHYREQLVDGLDQAPQAFMDLLDGKNFGKMVIRLGNDEL